jgi:PAS domain S-box-containing protein
MSARRLPAIAALTGVYFLAGRLGLSLAIVNQSASAIWPPTGLAIAALWLGGTWLWPAVLAGAFLVNFTTTEAVLPSLVIAGGNTAEALIAVALARRIGSPSEAFAKTTRLMAYVIVAVAATAVAASVGVLALLSGGLLGSSGAGMVWLTWWAGDLASAIVLTPVIVIWWQLRPGPLRARTVVEAAALSAAVLMTSYWIFGPSPSGIRSYPAMFMALPVLLWASLRFGPAGAAGALFGLASVAVLGTINGYGPFTRGTANEALLLLQAYLGVKMVVMLTLAIEVMGRRRVEQDIRQLNADLERRIEQRSEDLQRLHGRLLEAQRVAHIGSWEWDVTANSIWWSDEMYRVYGLVPGTPISYEMFVSMVHPDDRERVQGIVAASAMNGEPFTFEHRAVKPDGTVVILYSRGRVVLGSDGRAVRMLGIGHDITERKRAEEERVELAREQAARREAEEANRMKDYFLATLSHELRTPINAMLGWAQLLKQSTPHDDLQARAIEAIHRNATIQAQLVSDILDVARIRSGSLSIEARPTSIRSIVEGALDIMRPVVVDKQIRVVTEIPDDAMVMGDARRLQQVCWNMLSNSAKFLGAGGFVAVTARRDGGAIELTIEDNGPGIPEDFLPYAFDQFRQADQAVTRQHGGLGLGLAISRDLVRLHGGTIAAANRAEGGAIFTVRLPAAQLEQTRP